MLTRARIALVCVMTVCSALTAVFVSPVGDDSSGDGTIARPFQTLPRAAAAVRLINSAMTDDIFVYLRTGLYFMNSTFLLTPADSGFNGHAVHYSSYPGDTSSPVIHSGVRVTNWTQVDAARNIWAAPLPSGVSDTRQAYINGERMKSTTSSGLGSHVTITSWGYVSTDAHDELFDAHQAPQDIEFLYTGVGSSWTECRLRVASVSRVPGGGVNVTMQQPGFKLGINKYFGQGVTTPVSISNLYSALSNPGQSYVNSASRVLYYVPKAGENLSTADVIVPGPTEVLVRMQGNTAGSKVDPVKAVVLNGLVFAYAGWLEPNTGVGYVDMQSAFRVLPSSTNDDDTWVPVPGNIQMHTVENISVTGCTFSGLGATALEVDDASQSVLIANNTFKDVSCGGVYIGQVNDVNVTVTTRVNGYFNITNNMFLGIPTEFHDCSVILGGFIVASEISHNSIYNNSNTGISLGWGWARDEAVNARDNTITANYVYGSNWLLEDGGSIYVLGPQPRSSITRNYIAHQVKLFGALYTDEGSAFWRLAENVVHDGGSAAMAYNSRIINCAGLLNFEWLHIWTSSIHDEVVENNWSDQTYEDVHGTNITERNNKFYSPGTPWPLDAQQVINEAGVLWMGSR